MLAQQPAFDYILEVPFGTMSVWEIPEGMLMVFSFNRWSKGVYKQALEVLWSFRMYHKKPLYSFAMDDKAVKLHELFGFRNTGTKEGALTIMVL